MQKTMVLLTALAAYVAQVSDAAGVSRPAAATAVESAHGEYGFGLDFLRKRYSPPQPGENNHVIDLWAEQSLSAFARECNLTNNHALFINSHGGGLATARGTRYSYYPHQSLLRAGEKTPQFSEADMAAVLGADSAATIHNILISGCNADGSFNSGELRKYFVNATNIVHLSAGKFGYQPMFRQILASHSSNIQPLYQTCAKNAAGKLEFFMGKNPAPNSTRLAPYVAELFKPGASTPFKMQVAGRELLAPFQPSPWRPR